MTGKKSYKKKFYMVKWDYKGGRMSSVMVRAWTPEHAREVFNSQVISTRGVDILAVTEEK